MRRQKNTWPRKSLAVAGAIVIVAALAVAWPEARESIGAATCAAAEVAPQGTTVVDYSPGCPERYAALGKKTVLFFRAYWCGACADAAAHIADEAASGPSDLVIVEADFDDALDLRRRYGVTVQHTFVQVDARGGQIKKWLGSESLADVYAETE